MSCTFFNQRRLAAQKAAAEKSPATDKPMNKVAVAKDATPAKPSRKRRGNDGN